MRFNNEGGSDREESDRKGMRLDNVFERCEYESELKAGATVMEESNITLRFRNAKTSLPEASAGCQSL